MIQKAPWLHKENIVLAKNVLRKLDIDVLNNETESVAYP